MWSFTIYLRKSFLLIGLKCKENVLHAALNSTTLSGHMEITLNYSKSKESNRISQDANFH